MALIVHTRFVYRRYKRTRLEIRRAFANVLAMFQPISFRRSSERTLVLGKFGPSAAPRNCIAKKMCRLETSFYTSVHGVCDCRAKIWRRFNDCSFSRSAYQRGREPRGSVGRYHRPEGSAERASIDIEDAHQSHRRLPVEHGVRLARLARARQQNHCVQSILSRRLHVQGIVQLRDTFAIRLAREAIFGPFFTSINPRRFACSRKSTGR